MPFEGGQVAHVFENQGPPIGWSPDNNKWAESLHPEDAPGLLAKWERADKHGEPYTGECRFKAKDGSYKTVTFIDTPFEMNLAK